MLRHSAFYSGSTSTSITPQTPQSPTAAVAPAKQTPTGAETTVVAACSTGHADAHQHETRLAEVCHRYPVLKKQWVRVLEMQTTLAQRALAVRADRLANAARAKDVATDRGRDIFQDVETDGALEQMLELLHCLVVLHANVGALGTPHHRRQARTLACFADSPLTSGRSWSTSLPTRLRRAHRHGRQGAVDLNHVIRLPCVRLSSLVFRRRDREVNLFQRTRPVPRRVRTVAELHHMRQDKVLACLTLLVVVVVVGDRQVRGAAARQRVRSSSSIPIGSCNRVAARGRREALKRRAKHVRGQKRAGERHKVVQRGERPAAGARRRRGETAGGRTQAAAAADAVAERGRRLRVCGR